MFCGGLLAFYANEVAFILHRLMGKCEIYFVSFIECVSLCLFYRMNIHIFRFIDVLCVILMRGVYEGC